MENIKTCIYCGTPITTPSMEHIIQQAIGGRYESADILCPKCNEIIGQRIDAPFSSIFNPIVDHIEDFIKQRKQSHPSYKGTAEYSGVKYDVIIKNKRVVACPELSRTLRNNTKISKLNFDNLSYEFDVKNDAFLMGLRKIAFNFAIDRKIQFSHLQHGLDITLENGKLTDIAFNYPIVPFIPLNPMDQYLELNADIMLYHNLILFSQEHHLWCYIDLFNTFQYYVLLSDKWDKSKEIHETYLQLIQKIDRTVPEMKHWRPKYGLIYSDTYDVPSSPDRDIMKERVTKAIQQEPYAKEMAKVISPKLTSKYLLHLIKPDLSEEEKTEYCTSLLLYFNEDDTLIDKRFRQVTLGEKPFEMVSYPLKIMLVLKQNKKRAEVYQTTKLEHLNAYLTKAD